MRAARRAQNFSSAHEPRVVFFGPGAFLAPMCGRPGYTLARASGPTGSQVFAPR